MPTPEKQPPNGQGKEERARTIGQRVDRASDSAQEAWSETRGAFSDLTDAVDLKGRVKRNPYGSLAAALGLGYVVGGGLFTPLTARIVRLGLRYGVRLALVPLLKDQIAGLATMLDEGEGDSESKTGKGHKASKRT